MQKLIIIIGMIVGSTIGGYVPLLFGAGIFSVSSIIFGALGGLFGIYIGYKISQNYF